MKKQWKLFPPIICLPSILLIPTLSFAQNDSTSSGGENEIGIDLKPLLIMALGEGFNYQNIHNPCNIGLTYKRVFGKWALRTNFTFNQSGQENKYNGYYATQTVQENNTLQTRLLEDNKKEYTGRLGYEYRYKFRRGWSITGGADMEVRQTNYKSKLLRKTYSIDSVNNVGMANQSNNTTLLNTQALSDEYAASTQLGVGYSAGVLVPLGKHFLITAQHRGDFFFGPTTTISNDYISNTSASNTSITYYVDMFKSGLTEICLYYRFGKAVR